MARTAWHGIAPAKLNLYLHVTGRRDDGLHLLDGLVAFASVGDGLVVASADALTLAVDGPFAAALDGDPADNLAWRAATALAQRLDRPPSVAIRLTKNLPVASGIGGGSSDAAACLRALGELWECEDDVLTAVAADLGSDVPACLAARPLWLGGTGDRIEPAGTLPECGLVLVNPGIPLATASVYRAFARDFSEPDRFDIPNEARLFIETVAMRRNDLTGAAMELVPAIGEVLTALAASEHCMLARMSGSGATCFGLYAAAAEADSALSRLRQDHPDWWTVAATLNSGPESPA